MKIPKSFCKFARGKTKIFTLAILTNLFIFNWIGQKTFAQANEDAPYDVIIVPGFPMQDTGWADVMKIRVYWAAYLLEQGKAKHIIFSGGAVHTPYIESVIMKEYAKKVGVPEDKITVETRAEHSVENLYYSYQIARNKGFKKIAVATDPVQSYFLRSYSKRRKYKVSFLPLQVEVFEGETLSDPEIDASVGFVKDFTPLVEREGFLKRWMGTIGRHIPNMK